MYTTTLIEAGGGSNMTDSSLDHVATNARTYAECARIERLAAALLGTPVASLWLTGEVRQWLGASPHCASLAQPSAFCAATLRHPGVFAVDDALADTRFAELGASDGMRFHAGHALRAADGLALGTLRVAGQAPRSLDARETAWLGELAAMAQAQLELRRANHELVMNASLDAMTGMHNRRHIFHAGEQEYARARRYERPFAMVLIDLDRFKSINELRGQEVGDQVIVHTAQIVSSVLRQEATLGRTGGEEFAILLPEAGSAGARTAAERMRHTVENAALATPAGRVRCTVSIGVAALTAEDVSFPALFRRATAALLHAKRFGRNRVVVY